MGCLQSLSPTEANAQRSERRPVLSLLPPACPLDMGGMAAIHIHSSESGPRTVRDARWALGTSPSQPSVQAGGARAATGPAGAQSLIHCGSKHGASHFVRHSEVKCLQPAGRAMEAAQTQPCLSASQTSSAPATAPQHTHTQEGASSLPRHRRVAADSPRLLLPAGRHLYPRGAQEGVLAESVQGLERMDTQPSAPWPRGHPEEDQMGTQGWAGIWARAQTLGNARTASLCSPKTTRGAPDSRLAFGAVPWKFPQ